MAVHADDRQKILKRIGVSEDKEAENEYFEVVASSASVSSLHALQDSYCT